MVQGFIFFDQRKLFAKYYQKDQRLKLFANKSFNQLTSCYDAKPARTKEVIPNRNF